MFLPLDERWTNAVASSPYRLRFELNAGGSYVNMFTSSYDRARELARAALALKKPIAVIAAHASPYWQITSDRRRAERTTPFGLLRDMGVPTSRKVAWSAQFYSTEWINEGDQPCEHRALPVSWEKADILLWNNIAQDIGIEPKAPVLSKLANIDAGVIVNAYDDRGMDVIALSPEPILQLYGRYESWLLAHDRDRMSEVFGHPPNVA